jgi:hypothetical protein
MSAEGILREIFLPFSLVPAVLLHRVAVETINPSGREKQKINQTSDRAIEWVGVPFYVPDKMNELYSLSHRLARRRLA